MSLNFTLKQFEQFGLDGERQTVDMMIRCMFDPTTFSQNVFKHYDPQHDDIVQFKPYQFQDELMELFETNQNVCVKKSRNIGVTTTMECYISWLLMTDPNSTVFYIGNNNTSQTQMKRSIAQFIQDDDVFSIASMSYNNRIECSHGSSVSFTDRHNINSMRGITPTHVIIDRDFGFEDEWINSLQQIIPILSALDCKIIELININTESLFDNIFECKLPWNIVPGRDENFKTNMIDRIGDEAWLLQYGE